MSKLEKNKVYHGDCAEILQQFPSESIGIEIEANYLDIIEQRLSQVHQGLFS